MPGATTDTEVGGRNVLTVTDVALPESGRGGQGPVRELTANGSRRAWTTAGAGVLPVSIELAGGPERVVTIVDHTSAQYGAGMTGADPNVRYLGNAFAELAELAGTGWSRVADWKSHLLGNASAPADLEAHRSHGKAVVLP